MTVFDSTQENHLHHDILCRCKGGGVAAGLNNKIVFKKGKVLDEVNAMEFQSKELSKKRREMGQKAST